MKFNKKSNFKNKGKIYKSTDEIKNIKLQREKVGEIDPDSIKNFSSLPLSDATQKGLIKNGFTEPTKIQRHSLIHSLQGLDVVGAAKTGSGKTLAFIIPALELLHLKRWNNLDGLGVLIISPTRELAYQIFEVINKVGKDHSFSVGLIIGGKDLKFEWTRMQCNILICTPGRLLHHMLQNPDFSAENLQMLVLDEADLCLSLGFENDMNTILGELPKKRQTLLFSATQTRSLQNLVRAGCNEHPVFCSVHELSSKITPKTLQESYVVYDDSEKINFLWSFLKHHKKYKILVFLSTCKQVKFIFDLFTHLQPGLTVMSLHGNMNQLRRMAVFDEFCKKKKAVLFATDLASRGLDIPSVDWVLQLDCPEDIKTYIHRVGRTARHARTGEALLVLTPSQEEPMVESLKASNIPIEKIIVDAREVSDIRTGVERNLCTFDGLQMEAERAFKAYIKSLCLNSMRNKKVFNVTSIDMDSYARSLGMKITPNHRFFKKFLERNSLKLEKDNHPKDLNENCNETKNKSTKIYHSLIAKEDDNEEIIQLSESPPVNPDENVEYMLKDYSFFINPSKEVVSKSYIAKKLQKKMVELNNRVFYDDEGNVSEFKKQQDNSEEDQEPSISILERFEFLKAQADFDKKQNSQRVKEMHKLEKEKLKALKQKKKEVDVDDKDMLEQGEEEEEEESEEDSFTNQIIDELPDPDKIYTKNENSSDSSLGSDSEDDKIYTKNENISDSSSSSRSDSEDETEQFNSFSKKIKINKSKKKQETNKILDEKEEENLTQSSERKNKSKQKFSGKRKAKEEAKAVKRAKVAAENDFNSISCSEKESLALYLLQGT